MVILIGINGAKTGGKSVTTITSRDGKLNANNGFFIMESKQGLS